MNKFIPVLLIAVAVIVGGIAWLNVSRDDPDASVSTSVQQEPPLPKGHLNEPEVTRLSEATAYAAQLKGVAAETHSLRKDVSEFYGSTDKKIADATQKALQRALPEMERKLREEIRKEEQAKARQKTNIMPQLEGASGSNRVIDTTSNREMPLPAALPGTGLAGKVSSRVLDSAMAGVPNGFGFDDLDTSKVMLPGRSGSTSSRLNAMDQPARAAVPGSGRPGYVKISAWQPDQPLPGARSQNAAFPKPGMVEGAKPATKTTTKTEKPKPVPIYTIENTSTLFSNTTMTALMGVVPNKNNAVKNLMRFKIISGPENIASNGLYLPDVKNIIWTGFAIGNREMQCIQATVDTVTFTFQDGTIRTVENKQKGGSGQIAEGLGYLSDPWGKPCIKGVLISNATEYLRDRMIAAGAAATASAAAATQTTTIRDSTGGVSTAVTGSQGDFIAGQTGMATLNELADYLRDRMDQAVDIVYLDAGKDVVIHVEKEIQIDYDPAGRKLLHMAMTQKARRSRLD